MEKREAVRKLKSISETSKTSKFITYNGLHHQGRLLLAHSGLDRFIQIAARILEKRIGPAEVYRLNQPYFSEKGVQALDGLIEEVLILIGRHSNSRFGFEAKRQDLYFQRKSEGDSFPVHLVIARWKETKEQLIANNRDNGIKIKENLSTFQDGIYSKKAFKGISKANKVVFGHSKLTETETRAVGVLYMINFVLRTVHEQDSKNSPDSLPNVLKSGFALFSLLDTSNQMFAQSEGGTEKNKAEHEIIHSVYMSAPIEKPTKLVKRAQIKLREANLKVLSRKTIERILRELRK